MKIFIYLFIFFNFNILLADDLPFTYERLRVDFTGVTFNKKAILAYGYGSAIVRSADMGKSWQQLTVAHDSLVIKRIRNINDIFYGVLDKSLIIKSADDGKTWQVKKLEPESDIWDFDYSGEKLYVLRTGRIDILDFDLNVKDQITVDTTFHPSAIHIFNNTIYTGLDSGRIAAYDINNGYKTNIIDFKELGLCTNCIRTNRIMDNGSEIFVAIGSSLLSSKDGITGWSLINDNTLLYNINNKTTYDLKADNFGKDYPASILSLFKFSDKNISEKITIDDYPKRVMSLLKPTDYCFIGDDIIIAVGQDKLISMSYNGGINWKLVSYLAGDAGYMNWTDAETGYKTSMSRAISSTKNGGVTWLPQNLPNSDIMEIRTPNLVYFEKSGKGLIYKRQYSDELNNFFFTLDSGETYKAKRCEDLTSRSPSFNPCLIKMDSVYYMYFCEQFYTYNYTRLVVLDSLFDFISFSKIDSMHIINVRKMPDNRLIAIGLEKRYPRDAKNYDSSGYYIMYSNDGINWQKEFKIDVDYRKQPLKSPTIIGNKIIIGSRIIRGSTDPECNHLYMIDLDEKKTHELLSCDSSKLFGSFQNFGGWIFCGSVDEDLYYNKDFSNDPYSWYNYPFPSLYVSESCSFDTTAYSYCSHSNTLKSDILKLKLKKGTSVVETLTEDNTYLYAYPAYPQPASETVNSRVHWDYGFDINDADINVYDVTGQKISGRENITISKTDETSGILNWNCKEFPAGIYLIRIRLGSSTKTIRAAVIK